MNTIQVDLKEGSYPVSYELVTNHDGSITVKIEPVADIIPYPFSFDISSNQIICPVEPRTNDFGNMTLVQNAICDIEDLGTEDMCSHLS